ncbi:acyl-CoA dehydrogenase family protein [Dactylosporangium sp. NBC_01737]|uniref:acyl-CoA dehydrogenase family protein n=1 Tax=Dactylosporangium sp. NBC_01737 TaxID=2975959 RepID=UPI002E0DBDBD|nr:acyl-CoA dehydrogenase family protein [Dactylosporangium sp. NBC_01737]
MSTRYLPSPLGLEVTDAVHQMAVEGTAGEERWSPAKLWAELAAGGWTELADGDTPGADADVTLLDLCVMAEAWGRALVGLPLLSTLAARRWLAERPPAGTAITLVVPEWDRFLLPYPAQAALVLTGDGTASVAGESTVDDHAPSLPLGRAGTAPGPLAPAGALRDYALLATAEAVGATDRALQDAVEYAKTRVQFGRPIGSFQAVKHTLADMHRDVELARSGVTWFSNDPAAMTGGAPYVLQLCASVVERAIQVYGGIGYTWECDLHWSLRHVTQAHRLVVAALTASAAEVTA